MPPPYQRHVFVCTNDRGPDDARGSCGRCGGTAIRDRLKDALKERGLGKMIRTNAAGCLDLCAEGPVMVVYPEGVWYAKVRPDDLAEIIESHLVNGRPVERLVWKKAT